MTDQVGGPALQTAKEKFDKAGDNVVTAFVRLKEERDLLNNLTPGTDEYFAKGVSVIAAEGSLDALYDQYLEARSYYDLERQANGLHQLQYGQPVCVAAASATAAGKTLDDFRGVAGHAGKDGFTIGEAITFLALHDRAIGLGLNLLKPVLNDGEKPVGLSLTLAPQAMRKLEEAANASGEGMANLATRILEEHLGVDPDNKAEVVDVTGTPGDEVRSQDYFVKIETTKPAILCVEGNRPHMVYYDGEKVFDGRKEEPTGLEEYIVTRWWPLFEVGVGGLRPLPAKKD